MMAIQTGLTPEVIHVIEAEKHIEMLPGTEIMADIGGAHFVHAHNAPNATVLVPQPTANMHDPLNWSRLWKALVMINQSCFVLLSIVTTLSIAPLTPIYMKQFDKSLSQVALLTGATIIALGYANFIIIPCANVFGRRPVTLICCIIVLASNVWQATATSYESFLGARIVSGLGSAANESIMAIVVTDLFFLHERGRWVGLYFWCYFVGTMIGPIISGNVAAHVSWRWFFWACTISQAVNLISLLFLFPETRRIQKASPASTPVSSQEVENVDSEKVLASSAYEDKPSPEGAAVVDEFLGRGRPSRSQFNIFQAIDRTAVATIFHHIVTPVEIFFFPIVFWAAMTMGAAANSLLDVNLTQSQVFSAPPYNFAPSSVGFANFALVVGAMIGLAVAGPFSDWLAMRATRRNGGIREPEMRLPALVPFIIACIVGMTVVGVGYQKKWPWEVIIIIGFGLVGMQSVSIPTIVITYAIDCYKPIAGQIMVTSTVVKNTFGFGMTYFINDWAVRDGFIPPLLLLMGMTIGFAIIGMVLLMTFGKSARRLTRNSKIHQF